MKGERILTLGHVMAGTARTCARDYDDSLTFFKHARADGAAILLMSFKEVSTILEKAAEFPARAVQN